MISSVSEPMVKGITGGLNSALGPIKVGAATFWAFPCPPGTVRRPSLLPPAALFSEARWKQRGARLAETNPLKQRRWLSSIRPWSSVWKSYSSSNQDEEKWSLTWTFPPSDVVLLQERKMRQVFEEPSDVFRWGWMLHSNMLWLSPENQRMNSRNCEI